MNTVVASQWKTGMPPGIDRGLTWRRFGGLQLGLPARTPLICLKLYAAADQPESRHLTDLVALSPTAEELARGAAWIATQDPTIGNAVAGVIAHVQNRSR